MIGIIIVGRGAFAQATLSALEHTVGPQLNVAAIDIGPEDDIGKRREEIIECIAKVDAGKGVIIFSDMFGGTASNLAISAMSSGAVEVISSVNLPMLIAACAGRLDKDLPEVVADAVSQGRKFIVVAPQILSTKEKLDTSASAKDLEELRETALKLLGDTRENLLKIQSFVETIPAIRPSAPGIGHNNPPDRAVIDAELVEEGVKAVEILEEELNSEKPRRKILELCLSILRRLRDGIMALVKWLAGMAEKFLDKLVKSAGTYAGPAAAGVISAEAAAGRLGTDLDKLLDVIHRLLGMLHP